MILRASTPIFSEKQADRRQNAVFNRRMKNAIFTTFHPFCATNHPKSAFFYKISNR